MPKTLRAEEVSLAQERVLFYDLVAPDAPFHGVPRLMHIAGELNVPRLQRAINAVISRHEVLRTRYSLVDGEWLATVDDHQEIDVLEHLADVDFMDPQVDQLVANLIARPFHVDAGPVVRADVIARSRQESLFLLDFHHVACDGWSERIALDEICAAYDAEAKNRQLELPPLPQQYREYASRQRHDLQSPRLASSHEYWRGALGETVPRLNIPTDFDRPHVPSYRGSSTGFELQPALAEAVRAAAIAAGVTPYAIMLSAYFVLLQKWSGQSDVVIGSPINNREHHRQHHLIGYLVTRLPLRSKYDGRRTAHETWMATSQTFWDAVRHKDTTAQPWPFPGVGEEVREASNYRVMFFYQENPVGECREFADLTLTNANSHSPARVQSMGFRSPTVSSQLDLGFFVEPVGDRVFGWLEFSTDLFKPDTADWLVHSFSHILRAMVSTPNGVLDSIELPPRAPRAGANLEYEFGRAAHQYADRRALEFAGNHLTFADLEKQSRVLSLRVAAATSSQTVALRLPRSPEFVINLLAVLRAGKDCLLLDPSHPDDYVAIAASAAKCVEVIGATAPGLKPLSLSNDAPDRDGKAKSRGTPSMIFPTTGTTGTPKLVKIDVESALAGQRPDSSHYRLSVSDKFLATSPPSSARIIGELFWPWFAGACVTIAPAESQSPRELARLISRSGTTVLSMLPGVLAALLDDDEAVKMLGSVRLIQSVGESLTVDLYNRASAALDLDIVNSYGQTEACAGLFSAPRSEPPSGCLTVPVKSSGAGSCEALVVDENGRQVRPNEIGRLYLVGGSVAEGYLITGAQPTEVIFDRLEDGQRRLDTRHLARVLQGGLVEILGRVDTRVKINGFGVLPEEVEAVLRGLPSVREAWVFADKRGAEHVLSAEIEIAGGRIDIESIRATLSERLPPHMVPTRLEVVSAIRRGTSGKIDRNPVEAESYTQDESTCRFVMDIFSSLLPMAADAETDFFAAGGNSLLSLRAISKINQALGTDLSLKDFLLARTPMALALLIEGQRS